MSDAAQDQERIPWSDRFAIWRTRWFPYRTHEWLGPGRGFSRPVWQWPDVLGREFRDG